METTLDQLKGAWRAIVRAPGYAIVALLVLAIGIGATTTVYGVLKAVVLNPLGYPQQEQLVRIRESKLPEFPTFSVAPGKFMIWERDAKSFADMAMFQGATYNMTGGERPLRLRGVNTTVSLFDTLGVKPALGRGFGAADTEGGAEPVVLSHGAWMTHFGGSADALNRNLVLDDRSYTVVGVLPPRFDFPSPLVEVYTLWRPGAEEAEQIGGHYTGVVARLKPGVTVEQALTEMNTIDIRMEKQYPDNSMGWRSLVKPLAEDMLGDASKRLYLLLGGVALVLLIACSNVASLTLVRASGRVHEFAIRRAQGASDGRIARQLIAEGVILALAAGVLGALLTAAALPLIRAAAPADMPRIDAVGFDPVVLGVAFLVSLFAGVLASVAPAVLATRRAVAVDLRDGGRGAVGSRGGRSRGVLVATEVALAVVLLAGAALLGRSMLALRAVDPGFRTETGVYTRLELPASRYGESPAQNQFYQQLVEKIAALPGVRKAGAVQSLPIVSDYVLSFDVEGRPAPAAGEAPSAIYYTATPDYLPALGINVLRGRGFTAADRADAPRVMVVSQSFVDRYFPDEDVIGKRMRPSNGDDAWREVVGVVADVRQYGLDAKLDPQMYEPFAQAPFESAYVVVDSALSPSALTGPIRGVVSQMDANLPVGELLTVGSIIEDSLADRRFSTWLIAGFALCALLLAAIGLYGTLAYSVSQTTRELGVRIALGAQRRDVLRLVLKQGVLLAGAGALAGVMVALFGGKVLEGFVFGVSARDPLTLAGIVVGMIGVAFIASLVPALRATRVDPIVALRSE